LEAVGKAWDWVGGRRVTGLADDVSECQPLPVVSAVVGTDRGFRYLVLRTVTEGNTIKTDADDLIEAA
jgi:hypothetical protein